MKWIVTTITAVLVTVLAITYTAENKKPETIWVEETYVVSCGDTLWDICEEHCGSTYVLEYMQMVKSANGDLSVIYPGQEIIILRAEEIENV